MDDVAAIPSGSASGFGGEMSASGFDVPEHGEEEQVNYDHLSTQDLLVSSDWKARREGYIRCGSNPNEFDVLRSNLKAAAKESNPSAMEALLESLDKGLHHLPQAAADVSERMAAWCVEKGFSGRPKTLQGAQQLTRSLAEAGEGESLTEVLVTRGFRAKAPKVRIATLQVAASIVAQQGVAALQLKPLLKAAVPLFNDTDARVRKDVQNLCVECYRFTGPSINAILTDLRDVQMQELQQQFSTVETVQQPAAPKAGKKVTPSNNSAGSAVVDMNEEVVVLSKLPKDLFSVLNNKTEKWQDRLKLVNEDLLPLISSPKITPADDYTDLVRLVRDLINDPQMPLTNSGIKCVQAFAGSLRNNFSPYVRLFHPSLFDRLKDKKASMVDLVTGTYETLFLNGCMSMEAVIDEIGQQLVGSKVPHHKHNLVSWLHRLISTNPNLCNKTVSSVDLLKLLKDDKLEVRDSGVAVVRVIIETLGQSPVASLIAQLDPKMQAKIDGTGAPSLSSSMLSASNSMNAAPNSTSKASAKVKAPVDGDTGGGGVGPKRVQSAPNLTNSRGGRGLETKHSAPNVKAEAPMVDHHQELMSYNHARLQLEQVLDLSLFEDLASKEWRVRTEALNQITLLLDEMPAEQVAFHYEALVAVVDSTPGWKDSIVQVSAASIAMLQALTTKADPVPPHCAYHVISGLFPRLGDAKLKTALRDLLTCFATSNVGAKKTSAIVMTGCRENTKNTKIGPEAVEWLTQCVSNNSSPVDAKMTVDFVKGFCFEQPTLKVSGVKLLVQLRCRVGKKLEAFIGDINTHIKASYETELAKYQDAQGGDAVGTDGGVAGGAKDSIGGDGDGGDLPRVDVSQHFAAAAKEVANGADWKTRSAAVKRIEQLLVSAHNHASASGPIVSEAFRALKGRLEEPNKNLVFDSLKVLTLCVECFPASQTRGAIKLTLPSVLLQLGDQKANLREAAQRFSDLAVDVLGVELVLPALAKAVSSAETLHARVALVDILDRNLHGVVLPTKTLQPLVQPLMRLLGDRNAEIRAMSERLLLACMLNVGSELVHRASMDLKPAEQSSLRPVFERTFQLAEDIKQQNEVSGSNLSTPRPRDMPQQQQIVSRQQQVDTPPPPPENFQRQQAASPVPPSQKLAQQMLGYSVSKLSSAVTQMNHEGVATACQELLRRLQCDDSALKDPQLIQALFFCLRRTCYTPALPTDFVRDLLTLIQHLIKDHLEVCGVSTVIDICGNVFDCLLSDYVAHAENVVVKSLNMITLQLIQHPDFDTVFEALMHHLDSATQEYLRDPGTLRHKYVQLVCRCLLKQKRTTNVDSMLVVLNKHLERFPPSTFKDRDDLSVRTVKTLLNQIINDCDGFYVMERSEMLLGRRCLVYNFLDHSMREKVRREQGPPQAQAGLQQGPSSAHHSEVRERPSQHYADPANHAAMGRHSLQAVTPNVPPPASGYSAGGCGTSPRDASQQQAPSVGDEVVDLFARARKHAESEQALIDMYQLLKQQPQAKDSFMNQLSRCSDAFSKYMKRRLIRLNENDESGATFTLPFESEEQ